MICLFVCFFFCFFFIFMFVMFLSFEILKFLNCEIVRFWNFEILKLWNVENWNLEICKFGKFDFCYFSTNVQKFDITFFDLNQNPALVLRIWCCVCIFKLAFNAERLRTMDWRYVLPIMLGWEWFYLEIFFFIIK